MKNVHSFCSILNHFRSRWNVDGVYWFRLLIECYTHTHLTLTDKLNDGISNVPLHIFSLFFRFVLSTNVKVCGKLPLTSIRYIEGVDVNNNRAVERIWLPATTCGINSKCIHKLVCSSSTVSTTVVRRSMRFRKSPHGFHATRHK